MQWFTILLIGIAANIDNLGISVSYGLKSIRIPTSSNLLIAFISIICAFISISAGSLFSNYFPHSIANFTGGFLIICLGLKFMSATPTIITNNSKEFSTLSKLEKINDITYKESLFLGFLLAINCITIGFSVGITGVPAFYTSISIGIFSIVSISLGVLIGNKISNTLFGKYSNNIAGLLLIMIGIYEIFI